MELLNFIGGVFTPSTSQNSFEKRSPFDGSLLATVAASDAMDVIRSLQAARKASSGLRESSREERAATLLRMAQALEEKTPDYAFLEALHQGLPQSFVIENNLKVAIRILRETAKSLQVPLPESTQAQATGIIGIITSWCLSLRLVMERLAPALAAGNVCIIKISEQSPITAQILGEVLQKAGVPEGAVNILQGDGEVGKVIAGHPGIQAISAVGNSKTIEGIAKAGVSQFKKLQLSGSVKNNALILSGFDCSEEMPELLRSFLLGQGQMCWNTSRLFLLESMASECHEALKAKVQKMEPLLSPSGESLWTPLISATQVAEVERRIQEGRAEHGKLLCGGDRLDHGGFFVKPAWMFDLSNCSVLQQDELQGPLFLLTSVKYQHEMVKWVNTSYLAHSAVVWGPEEKLEKVTSALDVSQVWLNTWMRGQHLHIEGHKQSFFGNPDMRWSGSFYSDVKFLTGNL